MSVLLEASGEFVTACDGCGRTDSGPNQPIQATPYAVHDPNINFAVQHHYCIGCAANRGLSEPPVSIAGWQPGMPPAAEPSEPT